MSCVGVSAYVCLCFRISHLTSIVLMLTMISFYKQALLLLAPQAEADALFRYWGDSLARDINHEVNMLADFLSLSLSLSLSLLFNKTSLSHNSLIVFTFLLFLL